MATKKRKTSKKRPMRRFTIAQLRALAKSSPYPNIRRAARKELDERSWEKTWVKTPRKKPKKFSNPWAKRDVSRADLKHLSGAALMKLLRQAVRKGDDDMAEAIGKELDRRGGGFRRDAEDDYQFEGRVMQAARLARIVWKPSQMSAQQWPPRYAHVREAGGEFFVVAPGGDVVGVFASLPVAVRKARGVDRFHLKKYSRR